MGLKLTLTRKKLRKAEREARRIHGLQRRVRMQLDDLLAEKKKGAIDAEKFEDRKAKLEAARHDLIDQLKRVEEQERQLRAEVQGLEKAAA